MATKQSKSKNIYAKWLDRKGLSMREFSDATGIDYGTCYRWFTETKKCSIPGRMALTLIRAKFPDWPLAK